MTVIDFEPVVKFPSDPYQAGIMFMAVLAYPEAGAGQIGATGANFANALMKYRLWACSKAHGLRYLREKIGDPTFKAPTKRELKGILDRGLRRIGRRTAAYDLWGTQLVRGFFAVRQLGAKAIRENRRAEAFHINAANGYSSPRAELWEQATPSAKRIIAGNQPYWSEAFELNKTGVPADPSQKVKDDYERAFLPSVPVLHMVHALNEAMEKHGPEINGWGKREPITAMILNAELWIWEALETAVRWRDTAYLPGSSFSMENFIQIERSL
jgi:hypothetical protein